MFLFVSPIRFSLPAVKKTALTISLLMFSLAAHADSVETSTEGSRQNTGFAHRPHHLQASNTMIPPPPPGPYQSSALKDYSVNVPARSNARPPAMPMDMFSPDIPWPKNLRPEKAVPDHYVTQKNRHYPPQRAMSPQSTPPRSMPQPPHAQYNYPPRQNVSPRSMGPGAMNMNSSRWMPAINMAPPGPYTSRSYSNALSNNQRNFAPNYSPNSMNTPGYGINYAAPYGPSYKQPIMNNTGSNSVPPAYR